jgi:uncharacterized protein
VSDPNQVVAVGQRVKVRVMSVDLQRNRIALTMKTQVSAEGAKLKAGSSKPNAQGGKRKAESPKPFSMPKSGTVAPNGMRFK